MVEENGTHYVAPILDHLQSREKDSEVYYMEIIPFACSIAISNCCDSLFLERSSKAANSSPMPASTK